jgi:glycosyltransferase involved in cell wall biosynthesis
MFCGGSIAEKRRWENTLLHRILFVEDAPAVGGSAVCLGELVRGLDRSRFEPFVLVAYDLAARAVLASANIPCATTASIRGTAEPNPPEEVVGRIPAFKKAPVYRLLWSMKSYAFSERSRAIWLAEWITREGFALVHANNSVSANLAAIVAAARAGVPVVSHQRGYFRPTAFQRLAARSVDRFICISRSVAAHHMAQGFPANRTVTVYDGIDVATLQPRRRPHGDRALIAWAGRLVSWKGASVLVEAAEKLLERHPNTQFVIAGEGPELPRLRDKVERSAILRDHVNLAGFRADARDIIERSDVFVNSSIEPEPLGHSALEAMALGVPVVASACGGLPEVVEDGVSGLLFEPGDSGALAGALLRLIENGDLRARFGTESRRRAERVFSLENHVRAIEAIYGEAIERARGLSRPV